MYESCRLNLTIKSYYQTNKDYSLEYLNKINKYPVCANVFCTIYCYTNKNWQFKKNH